MRTPYFHVGVVVESIEATRAVYRDVAGLEFTPEKTAEFYVLQDGVPVLRTLTFCYSTAGSPFIELIEIASFPWGPESVGLHHFGTWSDDLEKDVADIVARGGCVETQRVDQGGNPEGFVYVHLPGGPRIELVDYARKAVVEESVGFSL